MWQNCSLSGCDKVPLPLAVTALPQMLGPGGSALGEVPGSTLSPLMLLKGTWWPWWPIELLRPSPQETWVRSLGGEDPWRRAWHPTPVFLPGESYGLRSLAGYNPWVRRSWVRLNDCTRMHTHNTSSAILEQLWPFLISVCKWACAALPENEITCSSQGLRNAPCCTPQHWSYEYRLLMKQPEPSSRTLAPDSGMLSCQSLQVQEQDFLQTSDLCCQLPFTEARSEAQRGQVTCQGHTADGGAELRQSNGRDLPCASLTNDFISLCLSLCTCKMRKLRVIYSLAMTQQLNSNNDPTSWRVVGTPRVDKRKPKGLTDL